jgi:hypothetical protein
MTVRLAIGPADLGDTCVSRVILAEGVMHRLPANTQFTHRRNTQSTSVIIAFYPIRDVTRHPRSVPLKSLAGNIPDGA